VAEAPRSRAPLAFLPWPAVWAVSFVLLAINTAICAAVLLLLAVVKLILPVNAVRRWIDPLLNAIAELWIANNGIWIGLAQRVDLRIRGSEGLRCDGWYLVEANHQSWVDIFVLQKVLSHRIPMLKFFLKQELIWVPLIGLAWWALDFPFMRRYSNEYLEAHPEKRGTDVARIRKSCEKFSLIPTSVMNFLEGTRFTNAKHAAEQSPFRHLLRPRAGGIALALNAMGERFQSLLDVTLFYPGSAPSFADLLGGRLREVVVVIRELPLPGNLLGGDYASDPEYRSRVQAWVHELWSEKDRLLDQLALEFAQPAPA
jgi:1-acyl-sn-glycerol-3-phosphate acyltransferase